MNNRRGAAANPLDALRRDRGPGPCRAFFHSLKSSKRAYAVGLLNDPKLSFATFFLLLPEMDGAVPEEELSERNRTAVRLCGILLDAPNTGGGAVHPEYGETVRDTLRWMFSAGAEADGMDADLDRIVDLSACILLQIYRDAEILPEVVRLLFLRNRKGALLHDLAWAFFRAADPRALRVAAEYLLSPAAEDAELARLLLHLPKAGNTTREKRAQYASYLRWLEENRPYLARTGESFNASCKPNACSVNLGAKYLHRKISPAGPAKPQPLTELEKNCLSCFAGASREEKELLARYSSKLREADPVRWNDWIRRPLNKQILSARSGEAER